MDEKTKALCEGFLENQHIIKKVFRGESMSIYPVAANAITAAGAKADEAKLKECKKIIRKNAGAFSFFKGSVSLPFAANLSLKEDCKAHFDKVAKIYNLAKKQFTRSEFVALLSIMLADYVPEENIESVLERGKEIYKLIKQQHPFLTNDQNSVFAGLLALSEKNNTVLIDDMEKAYELLNIKFSNKSSIHTVSHVLAITDVSARESVEKLIELYDALKAKKRKYGTYGELAVLAAVSILDKDVDALCSQILEIDEFLAGQKGYGFMGYDKKTRLLHAAMLTADLHDTAQDAQTNATASAIAMAAAQQLAISIVIASAESSYAVIGVD